MNILLYLCGMENGNATAGLSVGMQHKLSLVVDTAKTAAAYGSGTLEVFATPAMVALMEQTCLEMTAPNLPASDSTVGTSLEIKHIKATPVGDRVTCTATLTGINGPKLTFEVEAHDSQGMIGKGIHKRFIVDNEAFLSGIKSE